LPPFSNAEISGAGSRTVSTGRVLTGVIRSPTAVTTTVPVMVDYELTDLGLSLHQMMRGLKSWAETHMDDVLANRATYDTRTG
jgi:hypothetical protein